MSTPSAHPPKDLTKWLYEEGQQFPPGSEHIELPHMLLYTIFMGDIVAAYKHIELTLESMRLNPKVQFVLINIATDKHTAHAIREMKRELRVMNFHVKVSTFADLSHRLRNRDTSHTYHRHTYTSHTHHTHIIDTSYTHTHTHITHTQ